MGATGPEIRWYRAIVYINEPRIDGAFHGPTLTIDGEQDRVIYILRIESENGRPFPHGVDTPVKFAVMGGKPVCNEGYKFPLWVGSRLFGRLIVGESLEPRNLRS